MTSRGKSIFPSFNWRLKFVLKHSFGERGVIHKGIFPDIVNINPWRVGE